MYGANKGSAYNAANHLDSRCVWIGRRSYQVQQRHVCPWKGTRVNTRSVLLVAYFCIYTYEVPDIWVLFFTLALYLLLCRLRCHRLSMWSRTKRGLVNSGVFENLQNMKTLILCQRCHTWAGKVTRTRQYTLGSYFPVKRRLLNRSNVSDDTVPDTIMVWGSEEIDNRLPPPFENQSGSNLKGVLRMLQLGCSVHNDRCSDSVETAVAIATANVSASRGTTTVPKCHT